MMTWLQAYVGGLVLSLVGSCTVGFAFVTTVTTCQLFTLQPIILALCGGYVMGSGSRLWHPEWSRPPRSTPQRWDWGWFALLGVNSVVGWYTGGPLWALLLAVMWIGSTAAQLASYDRVTPDGREAPSGPGGTVSGVDVPS
jgi:hypothetical protein